VHITERSMTGTCVVDVVKTICVGNGDESFVTNMKPESIMLVDYIFCFISMNGGNCNLSFRKCVCVDNHNVIW
jgi:hypothetical protein